MTKLKNKKEIKKKKKEAVCLHNKYILGILDLFFHKGI